MHKTPLLGYRASGAQSWWHSPARGPHTLKISLNVVGYRQLSSVLSSPVPPLPTPKWACSTPSPFSLPLLCPVLLFCLLPLHSFPLSSFCFSSYQIHTFVSLQKNVCHRSHTFDGINRWSRADLKSTTLQQALKQNVMKVVLFVFCFISFPHILLLLAALTCFITSHQFCRSDTWRHKEVK